MLRVWNLSLLVATFSLTILGTFLTRSGVLNSVHAFGDGPVGTVPARRSSALVVVVSLGLIAWRGDRLRSPGAIDSPISREGAFLANNVLFTVFAFVVLLGTVFPLLVEALQDRQHRRRRAVLRPAVDADRHRAAVPDGRRAGAAVAQGERRAAARAAVLAGVVRRRRARRRRARRRRRAGRRWSPSGSAGSPPASALRQLVLATRRQGWRGLVGRANGGMIVHLGVIVIAVALVASNSYTRSATLDAAGRARPASGAGTRSSCSRSASVQDDRGRARSRPTSSLDGEQVVRARRSRRTCGMGIDGADAERAHRPRPKRHLPDARARRRRPAPTEATIRVFVKPLILWLWIGGGLMAVGTLLAAFPGRRRRRPTDPVSAPIDVGTATPPARTRSSCRRRGEAVASDALARRARRAVHRARRRRRARRAVRRARRLEADDDETAETNLLGQPAPRPRRRSTTARRSTCRGARATGWCSTSSSRAACRASRSTPSSWSSSPRQQAQPDGAELLLGRRGTTTARTSRSSSPSEGGDWPVVLRRRTARSPWRSA